MESRKRLSFDERKNEIREIDRAVKNFGWSSSAIITFQRK